MKHVQAQKPEEDTYSFKENTVHRWGGTGQWRLPFLHRDLPEAAGGPIWKTGSWTSGAVSLIQQNFWDVFHSSEDLIINAWQDSQAR